jgi:hypothetical protein
MTFSAVVPSGSFSGWAFLKRTQNAQITVLSQTAEYKNNEAYFKANIGKINTAAELVADPRLLSVALTAFGLEGDMKNKYFIQKVLEDGTLKSDALANRLANKQYLAMSATFGFGDFKTPRNKISDFPEKILNLFKTMKFEGSVGQQSPEFRLAMNLERELPKIAGKNTSIDVQWLNVMGSKPLRKAMEVALGLPAALGSLDLDKQLKVFKENAASKFGSDDLKQFRDPAKLQDLVAQYLIRAESAKTASDGGNSNSPALFLMQQAASRARF